MNITNTQFISCVKLVSDVRATHEYTFKKCSLSSILLDPGIRTNICQFLNT